MSSFSDSLLSCRSDPLMSLVCERAATLALRSSAATSASFSRLRGSRVGSSDNSATSGFGGRSDGSNGSEISAVTRGHSWSSRSSNSRPISSMPQQPSTYMSYHPSSVTMRETCMQYTDLSSIVPPFYALDLCSQAPGATAGASSTSQRQRTRHSLTWGWQDQ
jgi:hypothetical protein